MSKELLETLEAKVLTMVDTIDALLAEINALREERRAMEGKLHSLLTRLESLNTAPAGAPPETEPDRHQQLSAAPGPPFSFGRGGSGF